jgi:hypothetical protein
MSQRFNILSALALVLTMSLTAQAYPDHGGPAHNPGHPGHPGNPGYPDHPGHPGNPGYPGYPGNGGYGSHLSQNAPQIVRALYRGMLFREPDTQGFRNAVYQIQSQGERGLTDLAMGIGNSPEYHQNVETRYRPREIVRNLYRELLRREGEPEGIRYWTQLLRQGRGGEVLSGFVNSEEFRRLYVY